MAVAAARKTVKVVKEFNYAWEGVVEFFNSFDGLSSSGDSHSEVPLIR